MAESVLGRRRGRGGGGCPSHCVCIPGETRGKEGKGFSVAIGGGARKKATMAVEFESRALLPIDNGASEEAEEKK